MVNTHKMDIWDVSLVIYTLLECVLTHFIYVQRSMTLWTVAHPASLSMGFSRQEYCSGWSCPPPSSWPKDQTPSPALQADPLLLSYQGSPLYTLSCVNDIASGKLLYNTGSSARSMMTWRGGMGQRLRGRDRGMLIADSLCYTAETNTTL